VIEQIIHRLSEETHRLLIGTSTSTSTYDNYAGITYLRQFAGVSVIRVFHKILDDSYYVAGDQYRITCVSFRMLQKLLPRCNLSLQASTRELAY